MSRTRDVLFALTRQRFGWTEQERVAALSREGPIDWTSVAAIAAEEGVAPIVGVNLAACDSQATQVPDAIVARFQHALFENVALKVRRRRQLVEGAALFHDRGYDVMVLKSAALEAAGVYKHSWVTSARDVDLMLRRRDNAVVAADEWAVRAVSRDNGIECEINGHHDVSIYGIVAVPFPQIWSAAHTVPFAENTACSVFVMSPEDLLFTLCLNACRQRFFRLKALFDVAETVAHYPDLDWVAFDARARASDACGAVFTALCAADETVGLSVPAREHYWRLVSPARARFLRALIRSMRRTSSLKRAGVLALRYASFNNRQRFHSALRSALQWPGRRLSASDLAQGALPGQ